MKRTPRPVLGIDFGTSNSAVAFGAGDGVSRLIALEGDAPSMPTAVFFDFEEREAFFGREAIARYLAGHPGRLMRSLKSLLGSSLIEDQTALADRAVSYLDIIAMYLRELRGRAQAGSGLSFGRAVIGRPVHFVDDDPARDALAQDTLARAAREAGFSEVEFQFEPIAAALEYERQLAAESLVLVVDIGGGTSDFSVVRLSPARAGQRRRARDVLATSGVHVGGTDFDHRISLERVMPLLGYRHTGKTGREVPSAVFFSLSTWHLIGTLGTRRALADARELRTFYADVRLHDRLMRVLDEGLGHQIAQAVELAKIHASSTGGQGVVDLNGIESGLHAGFDADQMAGILDAQIQRIVDCAMECLRRAGVQAQDLGGVYLTGGSSALAPLQQVLRQRLARNELLSGDLFGAVATGLVYSA